jgi:hypothetical protein
MLAGDVVNAIVHGGPSATVMLLVLVIAAVALAEAAVSLITRWHVDDDRRGADPRPAHRRVRHVQRMPVAFFTRTGGQRARPEASAPVRRPAGPSAGRRARPAGQRARAGLRGAGPRTAATGRTRRRRRAALERSRLADVSPTCAELYVTQFGEETAAA